MVPVLFGLRTYYLSWLLGTVGTIWIGMRLARHRQIPARQVFSVLLLSCVTVLLGAKLLYLAEYVFFPYDDGLPIPQTTLHALAWHGFRIPGGMLLLIPLLPLWCRVVRLPALPTADAIVPAFGVGIFCVRLGCFFNGCCFGRPSDLPWAMTFPPGGPIFDWQLIHGLLPGQPTRTLSVQPLQVYFALLGLALYGLGRWWQTHIRFAGEVWLKFCLVFFSGTFALELLSQQFLHLNIGLSALAAAASAGMLLLRAPRLPRLAFR
jgi:phosphatidylglycerol:prolipoprotein diacylglycerol transferase